MLAKSGWCVHFSYGRHRYVGLYILLIRQGMLMHHCPCYLHHFQCVCVHGVQVGQNWGPLGGVSILLRRSVLQLLIS